MIKIPISYNLRNLAVRRATSVAAGLGIALVVFIFSSVMMLNAGVRKTLGVTGRPDVAVVISKGSDAELSSTLEEEKTKLVLAKEGIARDGEGRLLASREIVIVLTMDKLGTTGVSNVTVRGLGPEGRLLRPEARIVAGRWPEAPDEVVVGRAIRGRFKGLDVGQEVELRKNRAFKVVGVFATTGGADESEVWADFETLRTTFARTGLASSIRARLASADAFTGFEASIEKDKALAYEVMRETAFYERQSEGLAMFVTRLGMAIAIAFSLAAMVGAMITMYSSVANRQREIGTLRALGFRRYQILASFLFESVLLALGGGLVGAVASLAMGLVKFSMMNFASWSEIVLRFEPRPDIIVNALIFGGVMGVIGGFLPAWRASRMSPIQAMRG